ncbi:MAG: phage Gp37/Gp68 family protein [Thermoanaerobaculia bacterium]
MAQNSTIEWTEATWNPVTGCTKVSPGCKNCYAERMANRLRAMGVPAYEHGFELTLQPQALLAPLRWRKSRMIFVNSMSDLFHHSVPTEFVLRVMEVIRAAHWHQFQILTKRSERLAELDRKIQWPSNLWLGVSVESSSYGWRIDDLRRVGAAVRFLSLEPLLGPIEGMNLDGIHWVIAGGESGPRARPVDPAWIIEIRDQCLAARVPFFFKQWGGTRKKKTGRLLEGATWDQMPASQAGTLSV